MPPAKKTPFRGVGKDWSERYDFGVEPGLPLSPLRGSPAFSCPNAPVLCDSVLMYRTGSKMD
jgi:hypothetical protein